LETIIFLFQFIFFHCLVMYFSLVMVFKSTLFYQLLSSFLTFFADLRFESTLAHLLLIMHFSHLVDLFFLEIYYFLSSFEYLFGVRKWSDFVISFRSKSAISHLLVDPIDKALLLNLLSILHLLNSISIQNRHPF